MGRWPLEGHVGGKLAVDSTREVDTEILLAYIVDTFIQGLTGLSLAFERPSSILCSGGGIEVHLGVECAHGHD